MQKHSYFLFAIIAVSFAISCAPGKQAEISEKPKIVATTGMVADAVENLLGDQVELKTLMGPGVDPHLYKASQGDMNLLANADIIVYSGHHLEGKMIEVLHKIAKTKPVIPLAEYIWENRLQRSNDGKGAIDPHLWMDINSWKLGVNGLSDTLQKLLPNKAAFITSNFKTYTDTLEKVGFEIELAIASIPKTQRVLITSHDAFRYYGLAYGIEVKGLQGISTVSEYGLQDVSNMVNFIISRKIKSVFIESSISSKSLQAVIEGCKSKGYNINIGGSLYSDAMGPKGSPYGTYKGMLRHNTYTIVNALK